MNDADLSAHCRYPHGNACSICEEFYRARGSMCCLLTAISAFICLFLPAVSQENIINNDLHWLTYVETLQIFCWGGSRIIRWAQIHTFLLLKDWEFRCKIITQLSHRGIKLNMRVTQMINCFSFSTFVRHTGETGLFFSEKQNINHGH